MLVAAQLVEVVPGFESIHPTRDEGLILGDIQDLSRG